MNSCMSHFKMIYLKMNSVNTLVLIFFSTIYSQNIPIAYKDSIRYNFSINNNFREFDKTALRKRCYLYGDLTFTNFMKEKCKSVAVISTLKKLNDEEKRCLDDLLSYQGKFGLYPLAKPDEIVMIFDQINAVLALSPVRLKINDFRDLFISTGEQIGVKTQYISTVDSLIKTKSILSILKNDTVNYDIWWSSKIDTIGPNFGSSKAYEKLNLAKELYFIKNTPIIDNALLREVRTLDDTLGEYLVRVTLNKIGKQKLANFTASHINEYVVIGIDSTVFSCIRIFQEYSNGIIDLENLGKERSMWMTYILNTDIVKYPFSICEKGEE